MVSACTKTRFEQSVSKRFENGQSGIVIILMARYSIESVQKMLRENLEFWDISSSRTVDIYLAGYGAALPKENINRNNKRVADSDLFFNYQAFKTFKDALYEQMGLTYDDRIELFLLDYTNNRIKYDNYLRIDIGASAGDNQDEIRKLMAFLINSCCRFSDVRSLAVRYKLNKAKKFAKFVTKKLAAEGIPKLVFSWIAQV